MFDGQIFILPLPTLLPAIVLTLYFVTYYLATDYQTDRVPTFPLLAYIAGPVIMPEMVQAIKRASELIFKHGGIIRSMENVGTRSLPYKMFKHGQRFEKGNYFLIHFDSNPAVIHPLSEQLHLDTDVVRPRVLRAEKLESRPCLHQACDFGELTEESRERLRQNLRQFVLKL